MTRHLTKWLFGTALLLLGNFSHAQVGPCPPGMSQYPSSDGVPSCGPLRSEGDQYQPRGRWVTKWGALAVSGNGTTGWSVNQSDEGAAKEAAIQNCLTKGGSQCEVEQTYWNGCIALVNGGGKHNSATHSTVLKAIKSAMKVCKDAGNQDCSVVRTECSPAKWIGN